MLALGSSPTSLTRALFAIFIFAASISGASDVQQQHRVSRPDVSTIQAPGAGLQIQSSSPALSPPLPPSNPLDVRALATLAPARGSNAKVVRALSSAAGSPTSGLSSRLSARSLQDWEVEDLVLLATVDGMIYARDRKTGDPRWAVEADRPMVETTYHRQNDSGSKDAAHSDFIWIVEPSQDGSLYGFTPGSPLGMQKLGLTVKQLVEDLSPYASDDPPVVYTGEKRNTLYTVDAATGKILKVFNAGGSSIIDEGSCRRVDSLEYLDDEECGAFGTLTLARTEYTVGIQSSDTGKPICTIKYFEWGPNHRDRDLYNQYISAKDNQYIYSRFDGRVLALEHAKGVEKDHGLGYTAQQMYRQKFTSPVVQVFDIARPIDSTSRDTPLIILPQPSSPGIGGSVTPDDSSRIFVNCTESGSWYALSETAYPLVTDGAAPAICSQREFVLGGYQDFAEQDPQMRKTLVGVHSLSYQDGLPPDVRVIGGSSGGLTIDAPHDTANVDAVPEAQVPAQLDRHNSNTWISVIIAMAVTFTVTVLLGSRLGWPEGRFRSKNWTKPVPLNNFRTATGDMIPTAQVSHDAVPPFESVSQVEVQVNQEGRKGVQWADESSAADVAAALTDNSSVIKQGDTPLTAVNNINDTSGLEDNTPKKKKAHRGRRGGKKMAEKKALADQDKSDDTQVLNDAVDDSEGVVQIGNNISVTPDAVNATSTDDTTAPQGLQNLLIHTDKVLGSGSGGTFVFEGEFEGRDVAVKRMLPQYFELASQEVSLLEQSEDHPNVIRYFCRRADQHFLYIALELCQASLWDLFRDGRNDELMDPKYASLIESINRDPRKVLRQLAEGVKYLHSFRIVHRDIKPQNMLIAFPKKNNLGSFPRLVISDFGLCKTLPENASTLIGTTGNAGTAGWKAPELIFKPKDITTNTSQHSTNGTEGSQNGLPTYPGAAGVKRAVDIFSLGCVFFYVLTQGQHPFDDEEGWQSLRERNIKTGRANFKELKWLGADVEDLIRWMLSPDPVDRPTASQVLQHPFFWEAEDRLEFLSAASDRFDQEPRDGTSDMLKTVERYAELVIPKGINGTSYSAAHSHLRTPSGSYASNQMALPIPTPDFFAQLDTKFIDTLGKQRKYDPAKLADLLRALRNKHHHWDDMPTDVKKKVGQVPEGYLSYWEQRFPSLVVNVWRASMELDIGEERRFWKWFGGKEQ